MPLIAMLILSFGIAGCGPDSGQPPEHEAAQITYAEHVAEIIDRRCTSCHRDAGAAPFPLTTFEHVAERSNQILEVVQSGYMPPWLPGDGDHRFQGDRRLNAPELAQLEAWVNSGAVAGDPSLRPPPPTWPTSWAIGEPDLVIRMPQAYVRSAEPNDRWRNFVLPVDIEETRFVEAVDIDAGNPKAVHHAVLQLDATRSSRELDQADAEDGFAGMRDGVLSLGPYAKNPDGHFIGWTPGKIPIRNNDGMAWKLPPHSDLILQLHLPASGKDEQIQSRVGLYFADEPPSRFPFSVILSGRQIDIPPGEANHPIELEYTLPVDCEVLSVYPHAHYLCRRMRVTATLPNGTSQVLLEIPEWNFDWQDEYRFESPATLPKGTRVQMRYEYDNTANNPRNPNHPPQRVAYGEQSTDEMADLVLQLLPKSQADGERLASHFLKYQYEESLKHHLWALQHGHPAGRHHNGAGEAYLLLNQPDEALPHLQAAAERLEDSSGHLEAKMAMAYARLRQNALAAEKARRAADLARNSATIQHQMGIILQTTGHASDAIPCYLRAIEVDPSDVASRINLGILWGRGGQLEDSIRILSEAIQEQPNNAVAHLNLGISLRANGQVDAAIRALREAVRLDPSNQAAQTQLQRTQR